MARSTGITVSAVVVMIGSAFTVLCGAMILVASVLVLISRRAADAPVNLRYVLAIEAVLAFGFGGWGLASGIGLIKNERVGQDFDVGIRRDSGLLLRSLSRRHGTRPPSQYPQHQ
jgi:hypothetical protein